MLSLNVNTAYLVRCLCARRDYFACAPILSTLISCHYFRRWWCYFDAISWLYIAMPRRPSCSSRHAARPVFSAASERQQHFAYRGAAASVIGTENTRLRHAARRMAAARRHGECWFCSATPLPVSLYTGRPDTLRHATWETIIALILSVRTRFHWYFRHFRDAFFSPPLFHFELRFLPPFHAAILISSRLSWYFLSPLFSLYFLIYFFHMIDIFASFLPHFSSFLFIAVLSSFFSSFLFH